MSSQIVSIKLNFSIGEDGKRNALKTADSTFGAFAVKAGKVLGSGGHPLQSSNNNESRSSPELATKWPARRTDASVSNDNKIINLNIVNGKIKLLFIF